MDWEANTATLCGSIVRRRRRLSVAAKHRLHIIAVWIEDERCVVMWPTLAGLPIVGSTCLDSCGVKDIHLRSTLRHECGMLANRVRVIAIYPEDRILDAITDATRTNRALLPHRSCAAFPASLSKELLYGCRSWTAARPLLR